MIKIDWKPDKGRLMPMYQQICSYIRREIKQGNWPIGTVLPSQRQLSESFGVNRSTIVEAIEHLKSEGILEGRGRNGTIVINNTWSLYLSSEETNWTKYTQTGAHQANQPLIQEINRLEFESHMIRMGTGEISPDLFPREDMKVIFQRLADKVNTLGYLEPKGMLVLREAIRKRLAKKGIDVSVDQIMIVSGALQGLQLISLGITPVGSSILLERPSYLRSVGIFQSAGMQLKDIEMDAEGMMVTNLNKKCSKRNKNFLYTIPTFHNPTGLVMSPSRRKAIMNFCSEEGIAIIEDDAYGELWIDQEPPLPMKAFDESQNILYLGTVSKSLAPGFRIGWLVGSKTIVERLADIKMQTDYGSSSLSQHAIAEWMDSGLYDKYLASIRVELKRRRTLLLELLDQHFSDIARWNKPAGGFYVWLYLKKAINHKKLFKEAEKCNILINPGNVYASGDDQNIRLSYAYASDEEMSYGVKTLSALIKKL